MWMKNTHPVPLQQGRNPLQARNFMLCLPYAGQEACASTAGLVSCGPGKPWWASSPLPHPGRRTSAGLRLFHPFPPQFRRSLQRLERSDHSTGHKGLRAPGSWGIHSLRESPSQQGQCLGPAFQATKHSMLGGIHIPNSVCAHPGISELHSSATAYFDHCALG